MIVKYSETIPREIRAEMARRDISQFELATRIGWRQQKLSRRMSGRVPITINDLETIAEALGDNLRIELTTSGKGVR